MEEEEVRTLQYMGMQLLCSRKAHAEQTESIGNVDSGRRKVSQESSLHWTRAETEMKSLRRKPKDPMRENHVTTVFLLVI